LPKVKDTQTVVSALIKLAKTTERELYKSLTWNRDKELADHRRVTWQPTPTSIFRDQQSPRQRRSNENTNGSRNLFSGGNRIHAAALTVT
jgi:IS30 family transposase